MKSYEALLCELGYQSREGMMTNEYAFEMSTSAIRFGFGVTREVGAELAELKKQHVLVFTDPNFRTPDMA